MSSGKIPCPLCRHDVDGLGLEQLPGNILIVELQNVISKEFNKEQLCSLCKEDGKPAIAKCENCNCKMCEFCRDVHDKLPLMRDHMVNSLKGNNLEVCGTEFNLCPRHEGEKLNLYCSECEYYICPVCRLDEDHFYHKCTKLHGTDIYVLKQGNKAKNL